MNIPNLSGLAKLGKSFIMANRPEILFGASVVGTLATAGLSWKAGYDSRGIIDQAQSEQTEPLTMKEKVQLTWLCTMPAALTTVGTIGSTTGLHLIHVKEKKQLAAAAIMAIEEVKTSAKAYAQDVQDAIEENTTPKVKDKIEGAIEEKQTSRVIADGSLYSVMDAFTGRSFYATENKIQAAVNAVNVLLNDKKDVDLNYFYIQAGCPEIDRGEEVGWSGQNIYVQWFDDHLEDGRPCRKFVFNPQPRKGYDNLSSH